MIAVKYREVGQFAEALSWLRVVYDPTRLEDGLKTGSHSEVDMDVVWKVKLLRFPKPFTLIGIIDPDVLAQSHGVSRSRGANVCRDADPIPG